MRRSCRVVCALAAIVPATHAARAAPAAVEQPCLLQATVARAATATDPRSIALVDGRVLRLAGIESFSLLLAEGEAAEAALQRRLQALVAGADLTIELISDTPDRYGRLPALVAAADGHILQETLAGEGIALAFATGETIPCFARLLAAEHDARVNARGFWTTETLPQAWPASLEARVGRFAIFEGVVDSVGARPTRTYLNFGGRWSEDVTVEIEARHRERFGGEASLAELDGRRLRIRGFVQARSGPMVAVSSPMQIEVLGKSGVAGPDTENAP